MTHCRTLSDVGAVTHEPARRDTSGIVILVSNTFDPMIQVNEPFSALVVAGLAVVSVAGGVMLIANRNPGRKRWVRGAFLVILVVVFGLVGLYALGGLIAR